MKKSFKLSIPIILSLIIVGCNQHKQEIKTSENEFQSIDTILRRSEENFVTVNRANQKSDSSIQNKVDKTVKQISTLKEENTKLKKENETLKDKLDDATDVGKPFKLLPVSDGKDNR